MCVCVCVFSKGNYNLGMARKHMSYPLPFLLAFLSARHGPAAVDIINPDPRCNAISAHCARATSGYETQFSLFTPFPMRTPFSPLSRFLCPEGREEAGRGREKKYTTEPVRECFWEELRVFGRGVFLSPSRSLFLRGFGQCERCLPAAPDPRHEYSEQGVKEGRKKGL